MRFGSLSRARHRLAGWILGADDLVGMLGARTNVRRGGHAQDVGWNHGRATSPRGFPGAAKRATIAGMSWHHIPKDDAWKQAHLAMLVGLGKRAWLHCDGCQPAS